MVSSEVKVQWSLEADYFQACSCDYGCPCEFEAPPTQGFCEGIGAYLITQGTYGSVSLNGLAFGFYVRFPAAMHLGNGTLGLFIDEKADAQQRDALLQITSGKHGGLPFEVFPALITDPIDPRFVSFQFDLRGRDSTVTMGDAASMAFEPVKNPVTGEPEGIRIQHESGFIFKEADVVSAKTCTLSTDRLNFSWPDKAGFVAQIKYSN